MFFSSHKLQTQRTAGMSAAVHLTLIIGAIVILQKDRLYMSLNKTQNRMHRYI